ncbi:hypothetical protein DRP77_03145, partial [Candidatus Poribacteria bacterium]
PIVYEAYDGEEPIISGGRRIEGWRKTTLNGREVWAAEIERGWAFREIWVNGERRRRARHPNRGYLKVEGLPEDLADLPWNRGVDRFIFHEGDLRAGMKGAELVAMCRWIESRTPILEVDEGTRTVKLGKRTVFKLDPNDLYYVENAPELLDQPGEWYLDAEEGVIYYIPMPGEDMEKAEVIAPALAQLVRLEGRPEEGRYVEHVIFRGLTFSHAEWDLPPDRSGFNQAAVGVPGAVYGEGVRRCAFEGCRFVRLGTYALELSRGCKFNRIEGCEMGDLGAGGVKIGETVIREDEKERTHDNLIASCHIHDGGLIFHSAVGIWIGQSYNNRIVRNLIHDFYYTGISIGWTWGYGRALAKGNVVALNLVHHIGIKSDGDGPILSDMGGIYTLGVQPGTEIRRNIFHDVAGYKYGGWGIYLDEGSSFILVEGNLVYNTTHGGFHQHYGRENIVRNNIFALGRDAQIQRSRPEDHISFIFERNIVYWREGKLFAGNLRDLNFRFDHNLYWREGGGEIDFAGMNLEEWRKAGMDPHSLIADPEFASPYRLDFRLRRSSPAFKLGFKPLDLRGVPGM